MTDSRETILARLRAQARPETLQPAVWRSRRHFESLTARFVDSLNRVAGEALHAESLDAALDHLGGLLQATGARCVVVNDEPPFSSLDLSARWPGIQWHIVGRTPGDLRAFCAAADVGLSSGDAALAETGSVVITSGPGRSRLATLAPPVHIALVPTSRLTPDIFTWTAARQGSLPANLTIISGPSKTADIEQTMTVGVHGPGRFIVILYEE